MDRVTAVPESPAGPDGRAEANDYDSFGAAYTAETEASLINAYYCRPAIVDLAGNLPRAAEMGRAGRERALAEFLESRCVERTEALYERALGGG